MPAKYRAKEYDVWNQMRQRCNNPNVKCYKDYGGRGIKVCARWNESYKAFIKDLGARPEGGTLDRIDNQVGYTCGSCDECRSIGTVLNVRWSSWRTQGNNRRTNRFVEIDGVGDTVANWSRAFGLNPRIAYSRISNYKWNEVEAVTLAIRADTGLTK